MATPTSPDIFPARWSLGTNNPAGGNSISLVSAGGEDVFVAKYGTNQNLIWARRAGGTGNDRANGIAFDIGNQGGVILAGQFSGYGQFRCNESHEWRRPRFVRRSV